LKWLLITAKNGGISKLEKLLAKGADVNAKNINGETALKLSEKDKRSDIVQLLKKAGATE